MLTPTNLKELQQAVIELRRVKVRAGGTKPALSGEATLSTAGLRGVVNYDPGEFTFTAQAGTTLAKIREMLGEHRQFLAFDPPWVDAGATLGGTVAAGLSGSGRFRFGGVRDFLLGAQLVTGEGRVVFGGGKVVKNAAGFDIPKLMVGGLGQFGVLAELTFKVFPQVESYATLDIRCESLSSSLRLQSAIAASPLEPACIDLLPPQRLLVRVGGLRAAQDARLERLSALCQQHDARASICRDDDSLWADAREFRWADEQPLLARIAITAQSIATLDPLLEELGAMRRYSVAGNSVTVACNSDQRDGLDAACTSINRCGLVLRGSTDVTLGKPSGEGFRRRLRNVFDPQSKLAEASPS